MKNELEQMNTRVSEAQRYNTMCRSNLNSCIDRLAEDSVIKTWLQASIGSQKEYDLAKKDYEAFVIECKNNK